MVGESMAGGFREILVVLALALVGLVLATLAALTPWYAAATGGGSAPVVSVESPAPGAPPVK